MPFKPLQMGLPFSLDEDGLRRFLEKRLRKAVALTVTDNSTSMLSVRNRGRTVVIRAHRMFLEAGEEVLEEAAGFARTLRGKTPLVRKFIRDNRHRLAERPPRKTRPSTAGRFHDLREIYEALNRQYFQGRVRAGITWGPAASGRAVRRRTLGSYSPSTDSIRISRVLDRRRVPRYYLEFIVYHEMLHADLGVQKGKVHTREFRRRERLFRGYQRALAWEAKGA